jgi:hypothetical protein
MEEDKTRGYMICNEDCEYIVLQYHTRIPIIPGKIYDMYDYPEIAIKWFICYLELSSGLIDQLDIDTPRCTIVEITALGDIVNSPSDEGVFTCQKIIAERKLTMEQILDDDHYWGKT